MIVKCNFVKCIYNVNNQCISETIEIEQKHEKDINGHSTFHVQCTTWIDN